MPDEFTRDITIPKALSFDVKMQEIKAPNRVLYTMVRRLIAVRSGIAIAKLCFMPLRMREFTAILPQMFEDN